MLPERCCPFIEAANLWLLGTLVRNEAQRKHARAYVEAYHLNTFCLGAWVRDVCLQETQRR